MAEKKKKRSIKRPTARRKKVPAGRKPASSARARRSKKSASKTASKTANKTPRKKLSRKIARRPPVMRRARGLERSPNVSRSATRGLGPEAGGQSGDTEGISRAEMADSESVEELLEEGQAFEAGIVSGVENAPDADQGGVRTRQVPEDDVPQEYLDRD
jgi:hypothetical protein